MSSELPAPKVWPIANGAWQIRLPLPWELTSVNVFLFRTRDGHVLLDAGLRTEQSLLSLEAALHSLGLRWNAISEVLISHMHPDHIGAAAEIRRRTGAPVRLHAVEAEYVRPLGPERRFFAETARHLGANGAPASDIESLRRSAAAVSQTFERLVVDGTLASDECIDFVGGTLQAVFAPGHSPGLLCFYCPEQRVLFSTDAILPRVTPNIGVHWFYQGDPLGDYLQSLQALERLDARLIAPSHGRPFEGHRDWIANTRLHHQRRCESILEAVRGEPRHGYAIAGLIWGQERSLTDRRFAMAESLAHLEHLALQARVSKTEVDGVAHWSTA